MRAMVLRQIALTKCRASSTFSCDEGNEGNQFQSLWKLYKILVLDRVKESFRRAPAIEKRLPSLPSLPSCQNYKMPKPPTLTPKRFDRKLSELQLQVLAAAGAGNITKGIDVVINCYQLLYNAGVKDDDKLESLLSDIRKLQK
jgi:hypothetical protein